MKKILASAFLILAVGFASNALADTDTELKDMAGKINKTLPKEPASGVQWYKISAEKQQLSFYYTLLTTPAKSVNKTTFSNNVRKNLLEQCTAGGIKDYMAKKVNLRYLYQSSDKQPLASVLITPKDCGIK